ncbi:heavy metal translocating P-type ATPase [Leptotrichia sp. oral taxon 847]|uniref:heavy metal translocating P-type ATPase n=1 Tax=Leptotrichia sp. oral taxon 847 TaxID=1785996 RepID=UPI0007682611|nr:heavy metal translocating P-type ATPase [Leptotrichia sp. oral taxon 847]AMD94439.1 ATPase [Leptotrichia sp. oral taxon 847]
MEKNNECTLGIKGLNCPNCAAKIENNLNALSDIKKATVDILGKKIVINSNKTFSSEDITKLVQKEVDRIEDGVTVLMPNLKVEENKESEENFKNIRNRFILGVILLAAAIFVPKNLFVPKLILFLVSYFTVGYDVLFKAIKNIKKGQIFDENFLMVIATLGAFAIKEFPEAVSVMLFYQIGEMFQDIAVGKSRKSITSLMNIRPDYANLKIESEIKKVLPKEVKLGDIIVIKPGEKVALDGKIINGSSTFDTSALTGEAIPRTLEIGDEILSGFINTTNLVEIEVTKSFENSTVSKILDLVQNASSKKSKTENFITKFARFYTPTVVIIALLIAILPTIFIKDAQFSNWLYRALIFLVVSCPCALVVSIPLGFFGGIGGASKNGILIKGANYLEALNDLETVVFDKTGTLTKGKFKVSEINVQNSKYTKDDLLKYAAIAESFSNHPIAQSIVLEYEKNNKKIEKTNSSEFEFEEIAGHGVKVKYENSEILAGNLKLLKKENVEAAEKEAVGTVVYVAKDGEYLGNLIIADEIKEDAKKTVDELNNLGIKNVVMLTGDNKKIGENVANKLNISKVFTDLLPLEKVEKMEEILKNKSMKGKVLFVGDGINDAPVLARADIGVAMGGVGSDAALEAADMIIMNDEPSKIVTALKIAKKTKKIVWQNIIFALGVKAIILIMGALGFATMWEAVFGDVGVALIAILNATRALTYKEN